MTYDPIPTYLDQVDSKRLSETLFYLSKDPLPCRQLNVTLPGHTKNTLYEADEYIQNLLEAWGYTVEKEAVPVRVFRPLPPPSTPLEPYPLTRPEPDDPVHTAYNLYAKKTGSVFPDDLIVVISHKDSQSWIDTSPGANDNAAGTVGNLEIARILAASLSQRSIWFIYCNEEHSPWTSETAAQTVIATGLNVVGVLNMDGIAGKSPDDHAAGRLTNVTRYTTHEGERMADRMAELNDRYAIGLMQSKYRSPHPNDDDGSFIKAGIPNAVLNIGSFPYADAPYHTPHDTSEQVDIENLYRATRLSMAFVLHLDSEGRIDTP